jgi:hypothetical protein
MATITLRGLPSVSVKQTHLDQEARNKIINSSMEVENVNTPAEVINRLHDIILEKEVMQNL